MLLYIFNSFFFLYSKQHSQSKSAGSSVFLNLYVTTCFSDGQIIMIRNYFLRCSQILSSLTTNDDELRYESIISDDLRLWVPGTYEI